MYVFSALVLSKHQEIEKKQKISTAVPLYFTLSLSV
jgi:hypothetical protein